MKLEEAISAIKTFFLEILGFLLPGIVFGFVLFAFLKPYNQNLVKDLFRFQGAEYIVATLAYIIGYVLYGIGEWINEGKYLNQIFGPGEWQKEISSSSDYILALEKMNSRINIPEQKIAKEDIKGARRIAMSSLPENENDKIYTFMFRAELSQKTAFALVIISIIGFVSFFCGKVIHQDYDGFYNHINVGFLLFPVFFLIKTYRRFYKIAMKLAFPIYFAERNSSTRGQNVTA